MNLSGNELLKRWIRIKDKYMDAKKRFNRTGEGLDDEDTTRNIFNLKAKQEVMCPCFDLLDAIYGHKANVTPHETLDSMKRQEPAVVDVHDNHHSACSERGSEVTQDTNHLNLNLLPNQSTSKQTNF